MAPRPTSAVGSVTISPVDPVAGCVVVGGRVGATVVEELIAVAAVVAAAAVVDVAVVVGGAVVAGAIVITSATVDGSAGRDRRRYVAASARCCTP